MLMMLIVVVVEMKSARGVVAVTGDTWRIGLSTFATELLTSLAIAAGTDYAIFIVGRYQEAAQAGRSAKRAYLDMFRGTVHVIVGSGLTIVGAIACLYFTRLPYFQTLGMPAAIGVLVTLVAALTLGPRGPGDRPAGRSDGTQAEDACPWMAPDRNRRSSGGLDRSRRPLGTSPLIGLLALPGYQDQLRRPALSAGHRRRQVGVRGRRTALLRSAVQSGAVDDRDRSRHA